MISLKELQEQISLIESLGIRSVKMSENGRTSFEVSRQNVTISPGRYKVVDSCETWYGDLSLEDKDLWVPLKRTLRKSLDISTWFFFSNPGSFQVESILIDPEMAKFCLLNFVLVQGEARVEATLKVGLFGTFYFSSYSFWDSEGRPVYKFNGKKSVYTAMNAIDSFVSNV